MNLLDWFLGAKCPGCGQRVMPSQANQHRLDCDYGISKTLSRYCHDRSPRGFVCSRLAHDDDMHQTFDRAGDVIACWGNWRERR